MYVRLGRRGPRVSRVALGFWQAGGRMWRAPAGFVGEVVGAAIEEGINFFDTAEIYGWGRSERLLGEALREHARGVDVVVASKVGGFRVGWWSIRRGVEGINRRLGRAVDLIQAHWPPPYWVPLCRVIRALERTVKEGLASYYGLSNYNAGLVEKALECAASIEPVSNQVQYSLAYRTPENKLIPVMEKAGVSLLAWSPLAKGALAGASKPADPAQRRDPVFRAAAGDRKLQAALDEAAERLGVTRAAVALAWVSAHGGVPVAGTRRPERVREYAVAARLNLPEDLVNMLDEASAPYLGKWGRCYRALGWLRAVPCPLQYAFLRIAGGV